MVEQRRGERLSRDQRVRHPEGLNTATNQREERSGLSDRRDTSHRPVRERALGLGRERHKSRVYRHVPEVSSVQVTVELGQRAKTDLASMCEDLRTLLYLYRLL